MPSRTWALVAVSLGLLVSTILASRWLDERPLRAGAPDSAPSRPSQDAAPVSEPEPEPRPEPSAPGSPHARAVVRRRTPPLTDTLNVLVVGADRRPDTGRGGRPDTLLLAVLDERSKHVGLVSVPRDLYVEVPGHGPARINASFGIARRRGEEPMELLRRVVEDTLSLPIRHTVLVDLAGFERLVDAVGGVDVDVVCPIRDRFLDARAPFGRRLLDVPAGRRHFDGATASMYVRSRHGRSDFSRARRQQAVAIGIREKLGGAGGLLRLPAALDAVSGMVTTDMSRRALLGLARRGAAVDPRHLHGFVFGARETIPHRTPEGHAVLLPRYDAIHAGLARLFEGPPPGERPSAKACPPAEVALERPGAGAARAAPAPVEAAQ